MNKKILLERQIFRIRSLIIEIGRQVDEVMPGGIIDDLTSLGKTVDDIFSYSTKLSDEFPTKTFDEVVKKTAEKNGNISTKSITGNMIKNYMMSKPGLMDELMAVAAKIADEKVGGYMKDINFMNAFKNAGFESLPSKIQNTIGQKITNQNKGTTKQILDSYKTLIEGNVTLKNSDQGKKMLDTINNKKKEIVDFEKNQKQLTVDIQKRPTIDLDKTQGGKLEINKSTDDNPLLRKEPNIIEPYKPRNYDWIFGGDLKNHIGEFKSDWIGEDAIDYSKLEGKYDKYVDYGEEFPEDIIYEKLINDIRYGFYSLKNGNTYDTWNQFPIGGFEKYGIDDFRSWVKNLYETNRLTNIEIDKDGVPFQFKIEPESKVVQPAVLYGELPKSNFDEKMAWDLKKIADDPNLTPDEKYKKTLEKTNYYWRMKNINRGVKKIQDKKGAEFVLDDNGNFVLDPDYKPTPWKQDPDLNESIKKEINKIRKLL
jgi:hypothetical protein